MARWTNWGLLEHTEIGDQEGEFKTTDKRRRRSNQPPAADVLHHRGPPPPTAATRAPATRLKPDSDSTQLRTDARRDLKAIPRLLFTSSTGRKELPLLMIWGSIIRMVGAD
ncbi:hypothetical protein Vadar_034613 [Vaccinium darrowii]|uniref:Uncharacterized protein n=1 Tax=Vaccinium darrowii TaxID=229202 RepID=A0ACB7XNA3_9ERIC|nr:hypothetical protein Vadar_034613 [Vaccinium darrowii]